MVEKNSSDEYELLPHKEIEELREELRKLKQFEITPTKKLHVSLVELNVKIDKLLAIFEEASHEIRLEEGGISFVDKMRPVVDKMNRILEQNAQIAQGIVAVADMLKGKEEIVKPFPNMPSLPPGPSAPSPGMMSPRPGPGMPPPPPKRKRTFGII